MLISQEKFVKKAVAECAKHPTATPKGKEGAAQTDEADVTRTSVRFTLFIPLESVKTWCWFDKLMVQKLICEKLQTLVISLSKVYYTLI